MRTVSPSMPTLCQGASQSTGPKTRASAAVSSLQQKKELPLNDGLKRLDSQMGYCSTVMKAILRSVFPYRILLMTVDAVGGEGWRSAVPASCLAGRPWEPCYSAQLSPNTALALSLPHIPQLPDSSNFIFRQNSISALTWHSQKRHCGPRLPWFSIWLNHWGIKTTWVMSKPVEEHTNDTSVTLIDRVGSKCLGPLFCSYIYIYIYIYKYIYIYIFIYIHILCISHYSMWPLWPPSSLEDQSEGHWTALFLILQTSFHPAGMHKLEIL